jgi:hypothetical protein
LDGTGTAVRRQFQLARTVWIPLNFLMIASLQKFHHYYGKEFKTAAAAKLLMPRAHD